MAPTTSSPAEGNHARRRTREPPQPAHKDPLPKPFIVPNQWTARLKDAIIPDPGAGPTSLPDISPEDSISRAGKTRRPPVFRAEDMADYGRAGIAHRRTDKQVIWTSQRRISRDDQVALHQAGSQSPPSSPSVPTLANVRQWVRSVPTPTRQRTWTASLESGPPEPAAPPSPPRARSAMK